MREVTAIERAAAPYSQIGVIVATFEDGTRHIATCALVGRNDVLTAAHVIYDPSKGGWATGVGFYFGADYSARTGTLDVGDQSVELTDNFTWIAQCNPSLVFNEGTASTFTKNEAAFDMAVIGLSTPIGDSLGWLNFEVNSISSDLATQVGYPVGTTGMQTGDVLFTTSQPSDGVYLYESSPSAYMGFGSEGGPLLLGNDVIGVKSTGSITQGNYWADAANLYDSLTDFMSDDDALLAKSGQSRMILANADDDSILASKANDTIDGGGGLDTVTFSHDKSEYTLKAGASSIDVTDNVAARDGHDVLKNVERLQFADCFVAFDVNGAAGQAYRLYKAAFDRTPDVEGLGYQMHQLDLGYSVAQVASAFIASPEFQATYGSVNDTQFITLLYRNVLDREPDAGGLAYHLNDLAHGVTRAQILGNFSESPENQANVIGSIQGGMTYIV